MVRFGDGRDWFFERRFGLFIHWGLYAIPGWHEQHQWRGRVPRSEYVKLVEQWNPVKYDPDAWLDLAESVGMRYICLTTKHHDGFCLWDTRQTTYNTMNTPYGRDIILMLADACHRRSFPLCLYYSIADWHHLNYPNEGRHHELPPQPGDDPDWERYLEFLKAQVRELCTHYGELHGFWWDMNVPQTVDPSINAMIRQLQPNAVINNRGFDEGDFGTPERDYDTGAEAVLGFDRPTEACQSIGIESWGYRQDEDYYTDRHLLRSIDRYLARDAKYLLNVGPMADGTIPPEARALLERIGTWYQAVRESLEGVQPASHLTTNRDVLLTRRGNWLYVHLHRDPLSEAVKLKPIDVAPRRATLLNTGQPVEFAVELVPTEHMEQKPCLRLKRLPVNELANTVLVVKLEFDHLPDSGGQPLSGYEPTGVMRMLTLTGRGKREPMNRRQLLEGALAGSAALVGASTTAPAAAAKAVPKKSRLKAGHQHQHSEEVLRSLAAFGVNHICSGLPSRTMDENWSVEGLSRLKERVESFGIALDMVPLPLSSSRIEQAENPNIMLGKSPERDREVDQICRMIQNVAKAGIPAVKYNMSILGVVRTESTRGRGGARYSTFVYDEARQDGLTAAGRVAADQMWERITYFLDRVVPVAEANKVRLCCHPHDPGMPRDRGFRGVHRVLGSVDGLKRFVTIQASPYHGLNFCQGSVSEMLEKPGEEIYDVIRYFGKRGKIFNVHFRNIKGRFLNFQETFPDDGDVDMIRAIRVYKEVGYDGMIMPDHVPSIQGDERSAQAFAFAFGYIQALIELVNSED
jgi:alpha-L-fucosidase